MGTQGRRRVSGAGRGAPVLLTEDRTEQVNGMDAARWRRAARSRGRVR